MILPVRPHPTPPSTLRPSGFPRAHTPLIARRRVCTSSHSLTNDGRTPAHSSGTWMFFSGLYPISLGRLDFRGRLLGSTPKELERRLRALADLAGYPSPAPLEIVQLQPRVKEGGAFVRFASPAPLNPALLRTHLLDKIGHLNLKPFWLLNTRPDVHVVQGKPWLEDMNMFPNRKVQVEFDGPIPTQEDLWTLFRPLGRVKEIHMPTPKDPIQIAHVTLDGTRSAAIARSCLHGFVFQGGPAGSSTRIRILYSPRVHAKTARNWLGSHPKIVLPILALLLGGISYTFFDPVRQFFIKSHIIGTFDLQQNPVFSWLQKETVGRLGFGRGLSGGATDLAGSAVEKERGDAVRELSAGLSGTPGTFFILLGPKGSGKTQVVQSVLSERKNSLVIDCASLVQDATNDNIVTSNLAKSLGYFPQFSLFASVNNAIDMAAAGLVGQKVGFSSSPEDQIHQILDTAEKALRDLAKQASINRQYRHASQQPEAGNSQSEKESIVDMLQQVIQSVPVIRHLNDSDVPVVVLKDFSANASAKHQVLWECLASWASRLTENGTAHVVFTSENSGALKPLAQAFSARPVKSIVLTDATADSALQYVSKRLSPDSSRKSTVLAKDSSLIEIVGGRLTDLDLLVQKIESGLDVERAVEEIVRQSMEEIKRKCFVHGEHGQTKHLPWANHQVWDLIKRLSSHDAVPLHPILSETFEDDLSVLSALESTDLITLSTHENGETMIRVGKPVYRTAIQRLLSQEHFAATHNLGWAKQRMERAEAAIESKLHELVELGKLFPTIYTVGSDRQSWLFGSTLPRQIQWKVRRILEELSRLEVLVDSAGLDVQRAKSVLSRPSQKK
ncbi:hypothetical protein PTTG_08189 [Puccinia triticina 1-1 BBBD Race 1]|uniref:Mitochondrial escape protein 2 n=2 Tax=Puccinia triticina TaxID=208348 RepID=A0A180G6K9_PUCT1|nr:uncharacterized protein PtA15_16A202 [Puccinia triticina]OAV87493.1 hypothetical protein PTTG_08189 [Puccinia triticina 1-1 BBBD Race 1]WAQ92296.1 hypothetical protein PtA15_16A202 [Puccinia triticina]WAR64033.1 hypothetical protein PtB15_16B192 [Puccinia triticina]